MAMTWNVTKIEGEVVDVQREVRGGGSIGQYGGTIDIGEMMTVVVKTTSGETRRVTLPNAQGIVVRPYDTIAVAIETYEKRGAEKGQRIVGLVNHTLDQRWIWEPTTMLRAPLAFLAGMASIIWAGLLAIAAAFATLGVSLGRNPNADGIVPTMIGSAVFFVLGFLLVSYAKKKKRDAINIPKAIIAQRDAIVGKARA